MKKLLVSLVLCLMFAGVAEAACTTEEAQAKALEFSNSALALAQKDATKYQEIAMAMQKELPELQKNVNDLDALCKFYDDWIAKMK